MLNKKMLVQETNLDDLYKIDNSDSNSDSNSEMRFSNDIENNTQIQPATIYVYGNDSFLNFSDFSRDETNQYYSEPTAIESEIVRYPKVTRKDMFYYLIKYFTNYDGPSNTQNMCRFLAKEMLCDCSDCGGNDSIGECEIENEYHKHFENVIEYNEL
jgi:hypothetical protein